jgi:hypothetical protein
MIESDGKIKIELSYQYSDLDKEKQYGIVIEGLNEDYSRWIFYFLGCRFGQRINLYPFKIGKTVKDYKYCSDAERQANLIANKIIKLNQKEEQ